MELQKNSKSILWISCISFFSFLMFQIIWPYTSGDWEVDFLMTKQSIIHLDHYRLAFYTHIFSSLIVLCCGAFLFSRQILKYFPRLHRYAGRLYVLCLLAFSAPSGLIMACYSNGDWLVRLSFLILTPLWWWTTFKAYQTIRRGQVQAHQDWMTRSYALTLSAISLRLYQLFLPSLISLDPVLQYTLVSWLSWTVNLGFAEYLIYRRAMQWKVLSRSFR